MAKLSGWFYSFFNNPSEGDFTGFLIGGVLSNVLLILAGITAVFEYIWQPTTCLVPKALPATWERYAEDYCYAAQYHYVPLAGLNEQDLRNNKQVNHNWLIPILLLVHALLLRIPQLIWILSSGFSSVNLTSLVKAAEPYPSLDASGRQSSVKTVADYLNSRFSLRDPDMRRTKLATVLDYWQCVKHPFPACILACTFIVTKLAYALTTTIVFIKLCQFMQMQNGSFFGSNQLYNFSSGQRVQLRMFPQIIFCDYEIRTQGNVMLYTVQCILPLNRFYSILMILLWYVYCIAGGFCWITFVHTLFMTLLPWPRKWFIVRALYRRRPLIPPMDASSTYPGAAYTPGTSQHLGTSISPLDLRQFLESHVRTDGYLVLRYLSDRGNDLFVYELINQLWRQYVGTADTTAPSVYGHSVEQSPAIRHKYLVHQSPTMSPPSVEVTRTAMPTSAPSIPTSTNRHNEEVSTLKHEDDQDDLTRPLINPPGQRNGHFETTKM